MDGAAASSSSPSNSPPPSPSSAALANRTMATVSRHYFGEDSTEDSHCFHIDIIEASFLALIFNFSYDLGCFGCLNFFILCESESELIGLVNINTNCYHTFLSGQHRLLQTHAPLAVSPRSIFRPFFFYNFFQILIFSCLQRMEENYGMFVWPCSIILAEYVWQQRSRFSGKRVIELGAGTSLPGLVAAKVGADVTLTDDLHKPEVQENMRRICNLNKLDCKILGLTWGEWDAPLFELQPHIVLGADVFYDSTDFDDLFSTVTFLLQNSQGTVFITTYHNRSGHHLIEFLMAKWGLKCLKLLDGFSFIPACKASSLQGYIQLVEIALDDK